MSNPSPQARLIALINASNEHQWSEGELIFSQPEVSAEPGYNTQISASPAAGQPYTGNRDLFYNRVPLTEILGDMGDEIVFDGQPTTLAEYAASIAATYGVDISEADFDGMPTSGSGGVGVTTLTFTANPNSYYWIGTLTLRHDSRQDLADVIANNQLNGFSIEDLRST